jgi:hypothetical protein
MYKIVISKQVDNKDYDQAVEFNRSNMAYGRQVDFPLRYVDEKILETTVSDTEFNAIRKACIEVM